MVNPFAERYLLADVGREYQQLVKHALLGSGPVAQRIALLAQQVKGFFIDLTEEGNQSFSNHFARMSYVGQAGKLNPKLTYYLHQFDKEAAAHLREKKSRLTADQTLLLGSKALLDVIAELLALPIPAELSARLPKDYDAFQLQAYTVTAFKAQLRAVVLEHLEARQVLRVRLIDDPGFDHLVHYNRDGYNETFVGPAAQLIVKHFQLPLEVNLLAVEVDAAGELIPGHLIIDPDFLVDITAISKCFDATGADVVKYLLGRVTPFSSSVPLIAGNVANHFLDTAVTGQQKPFLEGITESFSQTPLQYARLGDDDVRDLLRRCEGHYRVIGDCVTHHFPEQAIDCTQVNVEPSFYSERYGIQGRLDLFQPPQGAGDAVIVELKSGKIYRPNQHHVNQEHYVQTLLYDLLIKSVFSDQARPRNYILYSAEKEQPLRYAPPNKAQQYEALALRNNMMAIERLLADSVADQPSPLDWLRPDRYPKLSGFVQRDLERFYASFSSLSNVEKSYLRAFVGFIAREQRIAKVGDQSTDRINGQAALWREPLDIKLAGYAILHDLKLQAVALKDQFPELSFARSENPEDSPTLTSFRRGDIVVLYPGDARRKAVLHHQVFKGTITAIDDAMVSLRLRATQPDISRFQAYAQWNIEGDLFDSSFSALYRNLAEFAGSAKANRLLALGIQPPQQPPRNTTPIPAGMTSEQGRIFQEIIAARDYYLLWGPPGTGKTSVMIHHLSTYFLTQTKERILILGFTNRAVDEICRAVSQIGGDVDQRYVRIGSSFSCDPAFSRQLLQSRIAHMKTRQEIREFLQEQRLVIGTVSSVLGRSESLFDLLHFDRLIIDEASQLLEPQIINLLTRFPRAVLIGDHRQLPAVVTQAEVLTKVNHPPLRELGITDLRNSLFERLYNRAQLEDWHWAFGQLTRQGRMHRDIAAYANHAFYDGTLQTLEIEAAATDWQLLPNRFPRLPEGGDEFETLLCNQSLIAVNTPVDLTDPAFKTNMFEAEAVVHGIKAMLRIYLAQNQVLEPQQLGVITPYRAQIARIKSALRQSDLPEEWHNVTVDTVERYQGASFDLVFLSLCANQSGMVARLSNNNHELKDRKLNVALTRARKRVVVFGNLQLLRQYNAAYADYIAWCEKQGGIFDLAALLKNVELSNSMHKSQLA